MATTTAELESSPPHRWVGRTRVWVFLAALAAHGPLLGVHLGHVWDRPHYRFALFLFPIVGWLLWQRWPRREPYVPARWTERLLLGGSVGCLSAAIWIHSPYLAAVSAILASGFAILHVAGMRAVPALFGTWMLLWLTVPPPLGFDLVLISQMQSLTSRMASHLLDLLGINHLMAGNIVHLPATTLFVDEACSGVHSLFALSGCTAVFAVMTFRTVRRAGLLLVSSLGWAILLNLFRVMTIALAHVWWRIDLANGWPHEILGCATFLIALGLMLSTDQWLHFVGYWISRVSRIPWRERTDTGRQRYRPSSSRAMTHLGALRRIEQSLRGLMAPSVALSRTALVAYGVLFATSVSGWGHTGSDAWTKLSLRHLTADMLPLAVGAWTRRDFQRIERDAASALGRSSLAWTYIMNEADPDAVSCLISLDTPFSGWHELTRCYEGNGWRLDERSVTADAGDPSRCWVESQFSKTTGEHALLVFGMLTAEGRPLTPPTGVGASSLVDRLRDRPAVQLQGFLEHDGPVDGRLGNELWTMMRTAANRIAAELHESNGGPSGG